MRRILILLCCATLLAGCDLAPRGAALQSEVLSTDRQAGGQQTPDFAVEPVTRTNLVTFLHWPTTGPAPLPWIDRVDQPNTRIITSGDTLRVTIWSTESNGLLTAPGQRFITLPDIRVTPNGTITLPYIDTMRVRGMSPERAREVIEERYLAIAPSAQVQVELIEGRERTVSLISGVASPGAYVLPDNDFTLLELIALGGGISQNLSNPQVRLQRGNRLFGISADHLLATPSKNTTLEGGDRVFLQSDERQFLSLGAAGREAVHPFPSDHVTALEALAIIGGLEASRADAKGILVLRRYRADAITADRSGPDHPRTVFTLDLTSADGLFSAGQFLIQPDDLVYVSESPITAAGSILALFRSVLTFPV
ncbi:polysaccharide biosynthesis/export family protein [Thalassorhabdomicrobium marinisediminis]|uniref:Polysaccharide biosynthesis protein n=1 Tax=Thalassorhabdomicrobium marinisediminis TaxID=2170577 RepID=A0A2T7FSS7_9RHOB|nr:polysaccharide biosynthesis/export family protein [Thalassorhabdomicrobium marinisediminis]PVA05205.1 polysaccharide biosynthesis protein [Thalassorhabdomicrobium marinisediminis]